MIITAARFLEWCTTEPPPPTAQQYFVGGGSLGAVVNRVKELIAQGTFNEHPTLRACVRRRLDQCVQYVEQQPNANVSVFMTLSRLFSKAKSDREYLQEARTLWSNLSNQYVSPLIVPLIAGPDKTLEEVVRVVVTKVLNSELYQGNAYYRGELRDRLYALAKQEWDYQCYSLTGTLRRTSDFVRSYYTGKKSIFECACTVIKHIDGMDGKIIEPPNEHQAKMHGNYGVEELSFKNTAWVTDDILYEFATRMLSVNKIRIIGCFQVSEAGIKRVLDSRANDVRRFGQRYALEITTDLQEDWVVLNKHDAF